MHRNLIKIAEAVDLPPRELWDTLCKGVRLRWVARVVAALFFLAAVGWVPFSGLEYGAAVAWVIVAWISVFCVRLLYLVQVMHLVLRPEVEVLELLTEMLQRMQDTQGVRGG